MKQEFVDHREIAERTIERSDMQGGSMPDDFRKSATVHALLALVDEVSVLNAYLSQLVGE